MSVLGNIVRWLKALWFEVLTDLPADVARPTHHVYYERGTIGFDSYGDRCLKCGMWDAARRPHATPACKGDET
jgi:hypothetical protein